MTSPLIIAGAALGGLFVLDSTGAAPPLPTVGQSAGDGATAAMAALRAAMPIAGVTWQVPSTNSPSSAFVQMRDTFVGKYGRITSSADIAPQGLSVQQIYQLGKAWIDAWQTGCKASATAETNFSAGYVSPTGFELGDTTNMVGTFCYADQCGQLENSAIGHPSSLGQAVCALQTNLDGLNSFEVLTSDQDATDDQTIAMFQLINRLAQEMEAADYTFPGLRESDKNWSLDDVIGGVGAGLAADAKFLEGLGGQFVSNVEQVGGYVASEAGKAVTAVAGAAAGAIVSSPLFWVAGLGLVTYLVFRRSM